MDLLTELVCVKQGLLLIDVSKGNSGVSEEVMWYDPDEITARR